MIDDRRDINTEGGDYNEIENHGQYSKGFLQRFGGGDRFVHALLRDHFAAQYIPK